MIPAVKPERNDQIASALRGAALELMDRRNFRERDQMLSSVVSAAVDTVPGVDAAGISVLSQGQVDSHAPTTDGVTKLDRLQSELREGPCITAIDEAPDDGLVVADDLSDGDGSGGRVRAARRRAGLPLRAGCPAVPGARDGGRAEPVRVRAGRLRRARADDGRAVRHAGRDLMYAPSRRGPCRPGSRAVRSSRRPRASPSSGTPSPGTRRSRCWSPPHDAPTWASWTSPPGSSSTPSRAATGPIAPSVNSETRAPRRRRPVRPRGVVAGRPQLRHPAGRGRVRRPGRARLGLPGHRPDRRRRRHLLRRPRSGPLHPRHRPGDRGRRPVAQPDRRRAAARRGAGPTRARLGPEHRRPDLRGRLRHRPGRGDRPHPAVPVAALHDVAQPGRHRTALDLYAGRPYAPGLAATVMAEMFVRRATQLLYGPDEARAARYQLAVNLISRCLDLARPEAEDFLSPHLAGGTRDPVAVAERLIDDITGSGG